MSRLIKIDVISDTVCPWCYVGKSRLEKAIQAVTTRHPDTQFTLTWHPFQLDPSAPKQGVNKLQMYNEKFGEARVKQMMPMMKKTFADEGLPPYSTDGLTGSTLDSHRLLTWTLKKHGVEVQNRLVTELFKSYFCESKFLGDKKVLIAAAERAGVPGAEAVVRDEGVALDDVQQELRMWRQKSIQGVPHFILNGKVSLSGAQPSALFEEALEDLLETA